MSTIAREFTAEIKQTERRARFHERVQFTVQVGVLVFATGLAMVVIRDADVPKFGPALETIQYEGCDYLLVTTPSSRTITHKGNCTACSGRPRPVEGR